MPAKRVDKYCKKATDRRETIVFKIHPIPSEQSHSAKNANNKKAKQKATMQINPKDHHHRQQKTSRSFQTFSVENYAKQHSGSVWRSREIRIWGCRKSRIEQARRGDGNTNCIFFVTTSQPPRRKIFPYASLTHPSAPSRP